MIHFMTERHRGKTFHIVFYFLSETVEGLYSKLFRAGYNALSAGNAETALRTGLLSGRLDYTRIDKLVNFISVLDNVKLTSGIKVLAKYSDSYSNE